MRTGSGRLEVRTEPPDRIDTRVAYRGRVFDVDLDTVRFPNGSTGELETIRHPGASAVLPLYEAVETKAAEGPVVVLIRQYRYAAGGLVWEVPAGKLDAGETPEVCARRELEEETGLRAKQLRRLSSVFTTPGFTDEVIHLFLATGLEPGRVRHEPSEFIEVCELPLSDAIERIRTGEISDAKTVCTLLYTAVFSIADRVATDADGVTIGRKGAS